MVIYSQMDIDSLWAIILTGDEQALGELIRRFEKLIRAESRIYGHVHEDVAQRNKGKAGAGNTKGTKQAVRQPPYTGGLPLIAFCYRTG